MIQILRIVMLLAAGVTWHLFPRAAIVAQPVVDLIGAPIPSIESSAPFITSYSAIPIASKRGSWLCPRIHQLLFNERVDILEERNKEVKVAVPNVFYEQLKTSQKTNTFWAPQSAFIYLEEIPNKDQTAFPESRSFKDTGKKETQHIVGIKEPFTDKRTNITYSAGTRFVVKAEHPMHYLVDCYNPQQKHVIELQLPKTLCISNQNPLSHDQQRRQLVALVQSWANLPYGFIPYVWGGCSFTQPCTDESCKEVITSGCKGYYVRNHTNPLNGFDCAGLITRAAQLCRIPYFFKNTTTITKHLKPITTLKDLRNGDIIWIQGHVMIVSDIQKNQIVEARGYSDGYGKVQEIKLSRLFKDISTFDDLFEANHKKQPLQRFNTSGKVQDRFTEVKFFDLMSAWQF